MRTAACLAPRIARADSVSASVAPTKLASANTQSCGTRWRASAPSCYNPDFYNLDYMRRRAVPPRFVNRSDELAWLVEGWDGSPQFRILYGRRRVGKSTLLDEFARSRRAVVYQAVEGTVQDHLRDVTAVLAEFTDDPVLRAGPLPNWQAVLSYAARLAAAEPFLFVLDEYQYAAEADDALASVVQRWWSREVENKGLPLYFVICGSYVRFFEKKVLNGPMYGRNTGIWKLAPLRCADVALMFPNWDAEDQVRVYAVLGGVPYYLRQFNPARDLAWNIAHHILRKGAALFAEAELVMREELRDPGVYFSILRAIEDGCTQHGEIVNRVRPPDDRQPLTSYLGTLEGLGFAEPTKTVVGSSRQVWRIADPYLRFWFKYVLPNKRRLERARDPMRAYARPLRVPAGLRGGVPRVGVRPGRARSVGPPRGRRRGLVGEDTQTPAGRTQRDGRSRDRGRRRRRSVRRRRR